MLKKNAKSLELIDFKYEIIIRLYKSSFKLTKIYKILEYPRITISSIIKKYNKNKIITIVQCLGRLSLLNNHDKRSIIYIIKKNG